MLLVVREVKERPGLSHPIGPSWFYGPCDIIPKGQGKNQPQALMRNVGSWLLIICSFKLWLLLLEGHTHTQHCVWSALYKYGLPCMFILCQNWFGRNCKTIFTILSIYTFLLNFPAATPWDTTGRRFLSESWREKSFRQISLQMKHFACF